MKKIALSLILPFLLNAADISQGEVASFTAQKYKVDYNAQTQENKDKLKKEYEDTTKVVNAISNDVKNDTDYKVAKNILALNVWTQKYAQNLKISDATLKELYIKEKPKTVPTYNLYNILVSDKKKADEIYSTLEKLPKEKRLEEFKKQVKLNSQDFISNKKEGNISWIEIQKLDKNIQENIKDKSKAATDTVIGVFSSTAIALGIMMMSRGGSFNKYTGYLIGDLLSIKVSDLGVLIGVFIVIVTLWYFLFNKLLLISVNTSLASSRGLAPLRIEICFAVALAIIVAVSIQWVGLLIINSMLVLPAAAARNLAVNIRQYHCYAVGIALLSGIFGLMLSYYLNTATGATIVIIAALIFFLSLFKK